MRVHNSINIKIKPENPWNNYPWILICLLVNIYSLQAKVLIFTYAYNRPDFITLQHKTFEHFLQNEYEFVVFNDAANPDHYQAIKDTCNLLNIACIDIPQEIHDRPYLNRPEKGSFKTYHQPSVRNSNVVQYSLDTFGFKHDDILMLVDSDMFLIKEFNVRDFMQGYNLAGFYKTCCDDTNKKGHSPQAPHTSYLWIGLVCIDMSSLTHKTAFNFNCGTLNSIELDAGGYTSHYISRNINLQIRPIERICLYELVCQACLNHRSYSCSHTKDLLKIRGFDTETIKFIQKIPLLYNQDKYRNTEFFLDNTFVHYRAGSNYNNASPTISSSKTNAFNDFIKNLLGK